MGLRTGRIAKSCLVTGAALLFFSGLPACKRFERKHIPVEKVEELGYPTCAGKIPGPGEVVASAHIRSGPNHADKQINERYSIRKRDCLFSIEVRQEWPLGTSDVEVLYDQQLRPLRIWKRMTLPGIERAGERADIRRYELRTDPVSVKLRGMEGRTSFELLKGGRPLAVVGPGRGLISMWIKRAKLEVGQKVREMTIDVRGLEKIEPVTLQREVDMNHPELGPVRVYTFFGRETIFVDEHDMVVGDLAGLRSDAVLKIPPPPALPLYGPLDPVNTP